MTERSAAWSALLPAGTAWVQPGRGRTARRLRRALAETPRGGCVAAAVSPWSRGLPGEGQPGWLRAYLALPSRGPTVLVVSRDAEVLRYVAGSVFSVPPGAGPLVSLLLTAGSFLLRFRLVWTVAAALRVVGLVLVGRQQ